MPSKSNNNKICCFCNSESLDVADMGELKKGARFTVHQYCLVCSLIKKKI